MNNSHGLFIPVHRVLPDAVLKSAICEAKIAKHDFGIDIPVIIIDDAKSVDVSEFNAGLVREFKEKTSGVELVWVGKSYQRRILDCIVKDLGVPSHLLESNNLNYGVIFNTLFLVGRIFGITIFHRRDSDVVIQGLDRKPFAPIKSELESVCKTNENGIDICVVGGNYLDAKGNLSDSALRLDECMKTEKFLRSFIPCIPEGDIEVLLELQNLLKRISPDSSYSVMSTRKKSLFLSGDGVDPPPCVDCGNVCFSNSIYSLIPSAPNDNLIGADYHFFNIARILNAGFVSHKCSVLHDKVEMRSDNNAKLAYWKNMYYFCDAEAFHFKAYSEFKDICLGKSLNLHSSPEEVRREFVRSLEMAKIKISKEQRMNTLHKLSDALNNTGDPDYQKIARIAVRNNYCDVLAKGERDLNDYIDLLVRWQDILDYIPQIASPDFSPVG